MSLPHSSSRRKRGGAMALCAILAGAAGAAHGEDGHQVLFSCGTDPVADRGFLVLEGVPDGEDWTSLRFRRISETDGSEIYRFEPPSPIAGTQFRFAHSDGPEGYLVTVRWREADSAYTLYSLAVPPEEGDAGGGSAGLVIGGGASIDDIACAERPYMFISYMRDAMACDDSSPEGVAGCAEAPPTRTVPLDLQARLRGG